MRNKIILTIFLGLFCLSNVATAQSDEVKQLLLNVEKLTQFKQILIDMKKGYQVMSNGYTAVKDISQGNFNIHKTFLDALLEVSPVVKKYRRIGDIVSMEIRMVNEYKSAFYRFKKDANFNAEEIKYISSVYDNLLKKSLDNIENLTTIVTANKLRMSDDERLKAIDSIYDKMQFNISFLKNFNNSTSILALQKTKKVNDVNDVRRMYEVTN